MGIKIAAKAIKSELPYEEAVALIIKQTLSDLEAVSSKEECYQAMEDVREIWWTREKHLPNNKVTLERLLRVYPVITHMLVDGWASKDKSAEILTVPETTGDGIPLSEFYSLTFNHNNKLPVKKIFPDRHNRTITQKDFQSIIAYIASQMRKSSTHFKM